jgi:hypothetical protein
MHTRTGGISMSKRKDIDFVENGSDSSPMDQNTRISSALETGHDEKEKPTPKLKKLQGKSLYLGDYQNDEDEE